MADTPWKDIEVWRDAVLSNDGMYRYELTREWDPEPPLVFVMLNPSSADALVDDRTIIRCMGFARSWGYGGIVVVNLFAYRTFDPREMAQAADPVGPENAEYLDKALAEHPHGVVAAWGAHKMAVEPGRALHRQAVDAGGNLRCLGRTKAGAPRHPLYLAADTPLSHWSPPVW